MCMCVPGLTRRWFGNISMSFYMVHMLAAYLVVGFQMGLQQSIYPASCSVNYVPGQGEAACINLGFPATPGTYSTRTATAECQCSSWAYSSQST